MGQTIDCSKRSVSVGIGGGPAATNRATAGCTLYVRSNLSQQYQVRLKLQISSCRFIKQCRGDFFGCPLLASPTRTVLRNCPCSLRTFAWSVATGRTLRPLPLTALQLLQKDPTLHQHLRATVPFRRDLDLIDRGDLLDQIHQKRVAPASRVALVGLAGVG